MVVTFCVVTFQGHLKKKTENIFSGKSVKGIYPCLIIIGPTTGYEGWHGLNLLFACLQRYLDKTRQGYLKVILNGLTNDKNSNFVSVA